MANTVDPKVKLDILTQDVITVAGAYSAPLSLFSRNFNATGTGSVRVKVASSAGTTNKNASTFGTGASKLDLVNVAVDLYSRDIHVTYEEYLNGMRLSDVIKAETEAFMADLIAKALKPTASLTNEVSASGNPVDGTIVKSALGKAKGRGHALVVDNESYINLLPSDALGLPLVNGSYGVEKGIHRIDFSADVASLSGVVANTNTVALAGGLPTMPQSEKMYNNVVPIGDTGLRAVFSVWFDEAAHTERASIKVLFGSELGDPTTGCKITKA